MNFLKLSENLTSIAHKKYRYILLAISGILTGLTLVFPTVGFIEWITLIPMCAVLLVRAADDRIKLSSLYLDGFIFFYSFYLVCYHWFAYLYPLEFVDGMTKGAALAVVILAWFGLSLLQALMGGVVFVMAGLLFRCRFCNRFPISRVFVVAGLWAIFEWSQTIGWWGVPWGRLPIGQSHYLIGLQTASLFSSYFVTFALLSVNCLIAFALIYPPRFKISIVTAAAVLLFQYGAGALIWFTTDVDEGDPLKVACIQGNISSSDKWSADSDIKTTEVYTRLINDATREGAELVLLPETAFPYNFDTKSYAHFNGMFSNMSENLGIYIVVGAYTVEDDKNSLNSLICYTPDGERLDTVYSKRHLVPFGEYVPLRPVIETLIPPLADLVLSSDDIDPGEGANVITAGEIGLGGLICFDSIYEELAYDSVRSGAELICLSTNDSWFSDSAALYMHNAQAQMRAIENGRYLVRSANTGISTVITPRGEVIEQLEPLVEGNIYATVYARNNTTPCTLIGNFAVYALLLAFAVILTDGVICNIINRQKNIKST